MRINKTKSRGEDTDNREEYTTGETILGERYSFELIFVVLEVSELYYYEFYCSQKYLNSSLLFSKVSGLHFYYSQKYLDYQSICERRSIK